jgi:hypothetical protein
MLQRIIIISDREQLEENIKKMIDDDARMYDRMTSSGS